jgi:hypothetical protein
VAKLKAKEPKVSVEKFQLTFQYRNHATRYSLVLLGVAIFGLLLAYVSLTPIHLPAPPWDILKSGGPEPYLLPPYYWDNMRTDLFFLLTLPISYWIGVFIIVISIFLMVPFLENRVSRITFILSSALLMTSVRMLFPVISATPYLYEPDSVLYMRVVETWLKSGFNIGVTGNYQHDFPISFLTAYIFAKAGISLDAFFRWFPSFIYAINIALVYFISKQVYPQSKRACAIAALLFSLSPFTNWVAIHFSPELLGTSFFLLALYLSIRFTKQSSWKIKSAIPVLLVIPLLILSHHLSTLYLAITLLGLAFSSRVLKGDPMKFLLLGVYTYTFWFVYGTIMYPGFFNIYSWFGFTWGTSTGKVGTMGFYDLFFLAIYPLTIILLFLSRFSGNLRAIRFSRLVELLKPRSVMKTFQTIRAVNAGKSPYIYVSGFVFLVFLLLVGFVFQALMPVRVFEVFLLSLYPLSSMMLIKNFGGTTKKRKALLFSLLVLLTVTSVFRFDRTVQRRMKDWEQLLEEWSKTLKQ